MWMHRAENVYCARCQSTTKHEAVESKFGDSCCVVCGLICWKSKMNIPAPVPAEVRSPQPSVETDARLGERSVPNVFAFRSSGFVTTHPVLSWSDVDGDTVRASIYLGDDVIRDTMKRRIYGVDCPELHIAEQKAAGHHVANLVTIWLGRGTFQAILFDNVRDEKYGRPMVDFIDAAGNRLSAYLLDNKLAHVYNGGTKAPWSAQELATILAFGG